MSLLCKNLCDLSKEVYDKLKESGLLFEVYPEAKGVWDYDKLPHKVVFRSFQVGLDVILNKKNDGYYIDKDDFIEYIERIVEIDADIVQELFKAITAANEGNIAEMEELGLEPFVD